MRTSLKNTVGVGIAVGSLVLLAGCGAQPLSNGSASQSPSASVTAYRNAAPQGDLAASVLNATHVDAALAARVPASIRTNGLTIATADGYPPMEMFDSDGKTLIGLDMSLARVIGNLWGVKADIQDSDQNAMIPGVASKRYDIVISGLNDTAARRAKVSFVDYAKSQGAIVVRAGNPGGIKGPSDLCGKNMAVLDNGFYMQLAEKYSADCVAKGQAKITISGFANDPEALLQIQNGRADADMDDYPVAQYRVKTSGGKLEAIELPGDALFGIGVAPSNHQLLVLLQDTLNKMIKDGSYSKIFKAWSVSGMEIPAATLNKGQ